MEYEVETAVVILNWNGRSMLEKFLPRLIACTRHPDIRIIIADNHSSDDSVAFLKEHYPALPVILNQENGGFAKGYNEALKQVNARFFVLLNSDIEVTPNWVLPIIEKMKADPSVAAAQPKIRAYHHPQNFEYAGAAGGFIDRLGYPFCRGRIFDTVEEDRGQYDDECEIFWATGAAMFVRSDLFLQHGGLDEDFFAHMEEIDFCWRMHNLGYKIMYYPYSTVFHIGGGTLPKNSPQKTYLNFRNNLSLLYKNLPKKKLRKVMRLRLVLDTVAAGMFLLKGQRKDFLAVFRAYRDFYKIKETNRAKRASLQQKDKLPGVFEKSIVLQYYIQKKKSFGNLNPTRFIR